MSAIGLLTLLVVSLSVSATGSGPPSAPLEAPGAPAETDTREGALAMTFDGQHPVIEISLNGRGPYRFILDTGASITVVDAALAEELALTVTGEGQLSSPAGGEPVTAAQLEIAEIALGGVVFKDVRATAMNLRDFLPGPQPPQGILSASIFGGLLLTIDYPQSRVTFKPGALGPPDGSEIFQYEAGSGAPTIPVSFAGVVVHIHLDTGSPQGFTLPGRYMDKLPLASPATVVGQARLVGREMPIYGARLKGEASFGRFAFSDPEVCFGEYFPVGNIGYEILGEFAVTLDVENRRLKLERAAEAPARPAARPRRYGVRFFGLEGNPLEVAGVDTDSVAARAGLRAGDRIVKMNGEPIASLSGADRNRMFHATPLVLSVERDGRIIEIRMRLE